MHLNKTRETGSQQKQMIRRCIFIVERPFISSSIRPEIEQIKNTSAYRYERIWVDLIYYL